MAAANKSLNDFVGRHGACEAVVSALEQRPRDLQLQASGVKAVRALALGGGRNVEVLADVRGPTAVARAAGLFSRDREVQLACLGAAENLCRGGHGAIRDTLVDAGSVHLLESALVQFASDAEVVSQGFRALVEITLSGASTAGGSMGAEASSSPKKHAGKKTSALVQSFSLPQLNLVGDGTAVSKRARPDQGLEAAACAVSEAGVSRAIETVLAALERNVCREVCLSAFDAINRLVIHLGSAEPAGVEAGPQGEHGGSGAATATSFGSPHRGVHGEDACAGGLLQLARVGYAVKRALKINGNADVASRGGKILTLISVARGRALAQ